MRAVISRNTVFCAMNDFGNRFQPKPLFMSSKMRSLPPRRIVEFHDVSCTRLVIVSQYTSVGIFAFPNVKVSIYSPLSLYDKTIRFSFPFLNKDGIQLKFNTVDFQQFSIQSRQTWNRRRKSICWHEYKNACNEPLPYLRFPPSMSRNPCGHGIYILLMPPVA